MRARFRFDCVFPLLCLACCGDPPADQETGELDPDWITCDGKDVYWGADRVARERSVLRELNQARAQGIECQGRNFPPTPPLDWHESLAQNLRCAMARDQAAGAEYSDWLPLDLAAGTDLETRVRVDDENCNPPVFGTGCITVVNSPNADPLPGWLAPEEYACLWLMDGAFSIGAVGSGSGLQDNPAEWMVAIVYPVNP